MAFVRLGQVLDIEWLLARDEGQPLDELARHDRQLLAGRSPRDAEQALELWLEGRRAELGGRTLGARVSELLTGLHLGLCALAAAAGAGTAEALLAGAGSQPTNVLHFLLATLVWPLVLLFGSGLVWLWRGRLGRSVLLEDIYLLLLDVASRLARRRAADSGEVARQWRQLRRSAQRYRDIETGTLIAAAQWYPLWFHLGAAASLGLSALLSDLAFAWSTTDAALSAGTLATIFRIVTAPWCSTLGVGCVSPELVHATQFSRFTGQYAATDAALASGAWWPALFGCLLAYGVLPRLLLSLSLMALVARRSRALSERVLELRARLRGGVSVQVGSTATALESGAEPAPPAAEEPPPALGARECWVIRWRGASLEAAEAAATLRRLGLVEVREDAAGGSEFERDAALIEASAAASELAVVLVVDGWEAPDKATRAFVRGLRARGARERPVFVAVLLSSGDAPELAVWRDRMRLLEDPFVSVHALVRRAEPALSGVSQ